MRVKSHDQQILELEQENNELRVARNAFAKQISEVIKEKQQLKEKLEKIQQLRADYDTELEFNMLGRYYIKDIVKKLDEILNPTETTETHDCAGAICIHPDHEKKEKEEE